MLRVKDDRWCFACGPENPHGLQLSDFHFEGDEYVVNFTPQRHHQGWQGITHGGIVATLLDEVTTRMLSDQGEEAVTAEMTIRYHQPLPTGQPVRARVRLIEKRKRLATTEAKLVDSEDIIIASAQIKLMLL